MQRNRLPPLDLLASFEAAARQLSFTRAGAERFITQSAMSARIAALEDELGTVLLDRRNKQFRMTFAGQRFLKHATRLLELQREIEQQQKTAAAPTK